MVKTISIKIAGKVQGVFFRATAKEKATELQISGFVRNEPDGSVYIEAHADENQLNEFIDWCRKGPPHARVTSCVIGDLPNKQFGGFRIERGY